MYIGYDYKEISVGDKFVVNRPGFRKVTWTRPLEVIKVTKTQFTLEPVVAVEDQTDETPKIDSVPQRFVRSNGRRVGDGERHFRGWRAERATEQRVKDIEEIVREQEQAENEEAAKRRAEEQALREKYGTTGITDETVQKKYIKPLVTLAEQGKAKVTFAMKEFKGKEITPDSFEWIAKRMARYVEGGEINIGLELTEMAENVLGQLIKLLESFRNGTRLTIENGAELKSEAEVAKAFLTYVTRREVDRFFNYGFTLDDRLVARQKFVSELRSMVGDQYNYSRVKVVKTDEEGDDNG